MRWYFGCFLLLLVAIVAFSLWHAHRKELWIAQNFPPVGDFVQVNGQRIHYLERGAGPPVVLIHGLSSNVREWDTGLMDRLAQTHRVIAFDRPGLGYTDHIEGVSLKGQAELLSDAALALGAENPIVIGHSFGGAVALAWAVNRPENISGLMVLSGVSHPFEDLPQGVIRFLGSPKMGSFVARMQLAWASTESLEREEADVFAPQNLPSGFVLEAGTWLKMRPATAVENMRQLSTLDEDLRDQVTHYPNIDIPVFVVHGSADGIVPYETNAPILATVVPGAHLETLEGIGHEPNVIAVDDVMRVFGALSSTH